LQSDIGSEGEPEDAKVLDVLRLTQKIAGAQDICHEGVQRRLPSTPAKAGIIDAQHGTAGPAEEFDIVQVRGEVARRPRAKQNHGGLILGHPRGLPCRPEPKAVQELTPRVGKSHLVGTQAEIRWHLIAIPIGQQDEGIEEAMQHSSKRPRSTASE
jgi:hypothetical protein